MRFEFVSYILRHFDMDNSDLAYELLCRPLCIKKTIWYKHKHTKLMNNNFKYLDHFKSYSCKT